MRALKDVTQETARKEKLKKYEKHIIDGRRFMQTCAFYQATTSFSEASYIAEEIHGEATEETFEVHFLYGKCLLELAKIENIEGTGGENSEKQEASTYKDETVEDSTEEEQSDSEKTEAAEDLEDESSSETDEEDEPIKLAWETLEHCRLICEKKLKSLESEENTDVEAVKTWKLNHADVLTSLGEHGIIDSAYEQAQKDLTEAVAIQTANLSATSRILANTTHLLAKAFNLDAAFDLAATHFSNSKNILIAKVEELHKQLDNAAESEKSEIEAEMKELKEVILELDVHLLDARASAKLIEQIKEEAKKYLAPVAERIAKLSGEETKDITDMVRRPSKRAASEEPEEEVQKRKSEKAVEAVPEEKAVEAEESDSDSSFVFV